MNPRLQLWLVMIFDVFGIYRYVMWTVCVFIVFLIVDL